MDVFDGIGVATKNETMKRQAPDGLTVTETGGFMLYTHWDVPERCIIRETEDGVSITRPSMFYEGKTYKLKKQGNTHASVLRHIEPGFYLETEQTEDYVLCLKQ